MRVSCLAIPLIAHHANFGSASFLHASDPQLFNVTSIGYGRQLDMDVARPNGGVVAHNEGLTKNLMITRPHELKEQQRNAERRFIAEGRKLQSYNWTQLGLDIDGEAGGDWFGRSVDLSRDGSILAVGAPRNDPSGRTDAGHVRVHKFNGTGWNQLGRDIDGAAAADRSGWSVSLSEDGSIVAIGAPSSNLTDAGHARVYKFYGTSWTQLGSDIDGEAAGDQAGYCVALSSDGTVVAVGAPYNDVGSVRNAGHVRVYKFYATGWTQLGSDIDGEAVNDYSGHSVALSNDGSVVAVGAIGNDPSSDLTDAGHARVYKLYATGWTQLGSDIDGEATGDQFGSSVALSSDGTVLAIGALSGRSAAGYVRVYKFYATGWNQLGSDIDGEAADDWSGWSVSLSNDGSVLAVGAPYNDPSSGSNAGNVRVYSFNGTSWNQLGIDIDGEATDDNSGYSVALSSDGSILAVGARLNEGSHSHSGNVRVYKNDFLSITNSPSSFPSKVTSTSPNHSPSRAPTNALSLSPSISPSSRLKNFSEKSIESMCSVHSDTLLLECSAITNISVAGVFKTSLVEGPCMAGSPPTQESPVALIALDVNASCKNSGSCNHTHCFHADFVVEGVSVLAAMSEVVSAITFENDESFSVMVETSSFSATSEKSNTTVAATVTASLGECGLTSSNGEALHIGDTAVVCISSPDNVQLSLKSVTANPGNQILVNDIGEPNFLTTFNDNAKSITLQTLMIPLYFDLQGATSGSLVIEGIVEISYSARHLVDNRNLAVTEEAFALEVPLSPHVDYPEIAQINTDDGGIVGWSNSITLVIVGAVIVIF
ncbi:hypothetical protein ACHAW6_004928 [Cyclotella cf. meneghiniana]